MITASRIRAIRAHAGQTQEQFAERFAVNRYVVICWEEYGIAEYPSVEKMLSRIEREQVE